MTNTRADSITPTRRIWTGRRGCRGRGRWSTSGSSCLLHQRPCVPRQRGTTPFLELLRLLVPFAFSMYVCLQSCQCVSVRAISAASAAVCSYFSRTIHVPLARAHVCSFWWQAEEAGTLLCCDMCSVQVHLHCWGRVEKGLRTTLESLVHKQGAGKRPSEIGSNSTNHNKHARGSGVRLNDGLGRKWRVEV